MRLGADTGLWLYGLWPWSWQYRSCRKKKKRSIRNKILKNKKKHVRSRNTCWSAQMETYLWPIKAPRQLPVNHALDTVVFHLRRHFLVFTVFKVSFPVKLEFCFFFEKCSLLSVNLFHTLSDTILSTPSSKVEFSALSLTPPPQRPRTVFCSLVLLITALYQWLTYLQDVFEWKLPRTIRS